MVWHETQSKHHGLNLLFHQIQPQHNVPTNQQFAGHSVKMSENSGWRYARIARSSFICGAIVSACGYVDMQHSYIHIHVYGLVQERRNFSVLAMGLRLSHTKPSIYTMCTEYIF